MTPWRFSSYSAATRCLRLYKHQYVNNTLPDYESGDMAFGSAIHSAVNGVLTKEDGSKLFEIYWSAYKNKDLMYGRHKWNDLAELGAKFVRNFTRLHSSRYELERAEVRLNAEYKGIKLEGTMDFYGKYNGRTSLRDFKTSGSNYARDKSATALQLNLYTFLAIESGLSAPETLGYTIFNKGTGTIQDLTWEFSESKMYEMLDELVEYVNTWDLPNGRTTYPKNLGSCLDFNRRCQYWSKCHEE